MKVTAETLCVCGHHYANHFNEEDVTCCRNKRCRCDCFMTQEQYEQLMLAGEELDGGADEFVEAQ